MFLSPSAGSRTTPSISIEILSPGRACLMTSSCLIYLLISVQIRNVCDFAAHIVKKAVTLTSCEIQNTRKFPVKSAHSNVCSCGLEDSIIAVISQNQNPVLPVLVLYSYNIRRHPALQPLVFYLS